MESMLLRCRDAGMLGPFCDYITDTETFDEAIRELRVHTKIHHERDLTEQEVIELKKKLQEKTGSILTH